VFQVRRGRGRSAEHGRIERAATDGEQRELGETAPDLEAEVVDVVVWHAVSREVDERSKEQSERPRAREGAGRGTCRDVERDDHAVMIAYSDALASRDGVPGRLVGISS